MSYTLEFSCLKLSRIRELPGQYSIGTSLSRWSVFSRRQQVAEQGDETLKKIAHELAEGLRKSASVDWSVRESIRTSLRLMMR
jgi:hypothetical protein